MMDMTTRNGWLQTGDMAVGEKASRCRKIAAEHPGAKPKRISELYEEAHGESVSVQTVRKALKESATSSADGTAPITSNELRAVKKLADQGKGLDELDAMLVRAQAVADAAGGLARGRWFRRSRS